MNNMQAQVRDFRLKAGLSVSDTPRVIDPVDAQRHIQMIRDEFEKELVPALHSGDLAGTYDGAIDLIYFLVGLLDDSGLNLQAGFDLAARSNLSKFGPNGERYYYRDGDGSGEPDGKVKKGPDYFEPDWVMLINQLIGAHARREGTIVSVHNPNGLKFPSDPAV